MVAAVINIQFTKGEIERTLQEILMGRSLILLGPSIWKRTGENLHLGNICQIVWILTYVVNTHAPTLLLGISHRTSQMVGNRSTTEPQALSLVSWPKLLH